MIEASDWFTHVWSGKLVATNSPVALGIREDRHFYGTVRTFAQHARGCRSLRARHFYRERRTRHNALMEGGSASMPLGGQWNFDAENWESFGAAGPGPLPLPLPLHSTFASDELTREDIALVNTPFRGTPARWKILPGRSLARRRCCRSRPSLPNGNRSLGATTTPSGPANHGSSMPIFQRRSTLSCCTYARWSMPQLRRSKRAAPRWPAWKGLCSRFWVGANTFGVSTGP